MGRLAKKPEMEKYMKECVDIIVLDEVDEMVRNPGFFKQIKPICSICTKARVFAFTATPSDKALKFKSLPLGSLIHLDADDADSSNHVHEISASRAKTLCLPYWHLLKRVCQQSHDILQYFHVRRIRIPLPREGWM
jgi:superfamily II DNA/RNA helicase